MRYSWKTCLCGMVFFSPVSTRWRYVRFCSRRQAWASWQLQDGVTHTHNGRITFPNPNLSHRQKMSKGPGSGTTPSLWEQPLLGAMLPASALHQSSDRTGEVCASACVPCRCCPSSFVSLGKTKVQHDEEGSQGNSTWKKCHCRT